jgi:RAT1-interacting protein
MSTRQQTGPRLHHYLPLPPLSLREVPPVLRQPHLITTYSHLPDRSIVPGDASMAYHSPCPIGSDLNYGFSRRIERKADEEEHLDGLCDALRRVWDDGDQGERQGGIITWRGMITR